MDARRHHRRHRQDLHGILLQRPPDGRDRSRPAKLQTLKMVVQGTAPISRVTLVRNETDFPSLSHRSRTPSSFNETFRRRQIRSTAKTRYYLRVEQVRRQHGLDLAGLGGRKVARWIDSHCVRTTVRFINTQHEFASWKNSPRSAFPFSRCSSSRHPVHSPAPTPSPPYATGDPKWPDNVVDLWKDIDFRVRTLSKQKSSKSGPRMASFVAT